MNLKEEILTLRLVGEDMFPAKVKVGELGALLYNYEKALKSIIANEFKASEYNDKHFYLTLSDVKSESAGYTTAAFSPERNFRPALHNLDKIIKSQDAGLLSQKTYESVNKITGWLRTHKCDAELYSYDELVTTIPKNLNLAEFTNQITERTTIYGEIIDVGKLDPRVEIKLVSGENLYFSIKVEEAVELAKFLYEKVALTGVSTVHPHTYKIHSFNLDHFDIINDQSYEEKFKRLKGVIGQIWDQIDDPIEYLELNE